MSNAGRSLKPTKEGADSAKNGNNEGKKKPASIDSQLVGHPHPHPTSAPQAAVGNGNTPTSADGRSASGIISLHSQDFMHFLATQDLSKLVAVTKDGQRISANFNGSPFPNHGGSSSTPSTSSSTSVFKSLEALKSFDSTAGGSVNNNTTDNRINTNNVIGTSDTTEFSANRQRSSSGSTASYVQPLKGGSFDKDPVLPPGGLSRLSSLGSTSWDPFLSKDWAKDYGGTHVEVSYVNVFEQDVPPPPTNAVTTTTTAAGAATASATTTTNGGSYFTSSNKATLPPKKRSQTTSSGDPDWSAMVKSGLNPLIEAASRLDGQSSEMQSKLMTYSNGFGRLPNSATTPAGGGGGGNSFGGMPVMSVTPATATATMRTQIMAAGAPAAAAVGAGAASVSAASLAHTTKLAAPSNKPAKKRKPRKIIPEVKTYVDFTDQDVLFGRGGRSNHHPGNKTYRDLVTSKQEFYRQCEKNEKTQVAQDLVDHVQTNLKGRFLELDKDADRWYVVPNIVARRKVGQALREDNTEEARAEKRRKYLGKFKNGNGKVKAGERLDQSSTVALASG